MSESQKSQMATLLGVVVGAALDIGITPEQLAKVFSRKNIMAAAEVVGSAESGRPVSGM